MVFVDKSLDQMLDEVKFEKFGAYWFITPEDRREIDVDSNCIVTESFGEELHKHINDPASIYTIFCAIENAYMRGNKYNNDPNEGSRTNGYLPLTVKTFVGKRGMVVRIRDSGNGFSFKSKIKALRKEATGKDTFFDGSEHCVYETTGEGGDGMKEMDQGWPQCTYEGDGSVVNIMILSRKYCP